MCNIEITFDFALRNIYTNNNDVFTQLHDYYSTTIRDSYTTFRPFCIYIRDWTFVDARLLSISGIIHTWIVKCPQIYKASDNRHTQMVLYTRARMHSFTHIKGLYRITLMTIRENDFLRYRMKNRCANSKEILMKSVLRN